ncbi:aminopeptidase N [Alteromonas sp. W364]|uniref:aminopeptidase N n=1 Tax=Alteromonas sp. W364 TaxID=3075610 RepID=UPI0028849485|nr:aminopeptidase N [Alteromonas sp. W364]MDT0627158.1 aminopeptidase N [Alteromonas sp. W364]
MTQSISKKRSDYRAPEYLIDTINLFVRLHPTETSVVSELNIRLNTSVERHDADLCLDGQDLQLKAVLLNGERVDSYVQNQNQLIIPYESIKDLKEFTLSISNTINPQDNGSLEGLYLSNNAYCTQCEAEGFRKITYFLDRPDVLSVYTVKIEADKQQFPHVLSNGNLIEDTTNERGLRCVTWHDPFPKPCYLFALVAGDFDKLSDSFTTSSGREVALELFVDKGKREQGHHALSSLKKAMKWDEEAFGLEYDLDIYMVVAVDFFNMGAMENKGLNVFNSKYVLADANTATDDDFFNIESIIGHEYFHNWTGNRVTCRDWFQLSLKEGLTVFRDQKFSADMFSELATRINQVKVMREHQFAEDAGPMSHPIRPDEVIEMNNFYTVTVYDKGAEVIRMLHTLLGESGFRAGMDLYFERHDGQAVTCDDFVNAMQDANDADLNHFKLWYSQSGTPEVTVEKIPKTEHEPMRLQFSQTTSPTSDQVNKQALYLPIKLECIEYNGSSVALDLQQGTFVLDTETASLDVHANDCVPVLLSDFSAPVKVHYDYSLEELLLILQHAQSDYSRWDASQSIYQRLITQHYESMTSQKNKDVVQASRIDNDVIEILQKVFVELEHEPELLSELLTVPSTESLMQGLSDVDPLLLVAAKKNVIGELSRALSSYLITRYQALTKLDKDYVYNKESANHRRLSNAMLYLLASNDTEEVQAMIQDRYRRADNMTDLLGALKAAQQSSLSLFEDLMQKFEESYQDNAVVMDKWFSLHATTSYSDILERLTLLASHRQFNMKNPNKVRSLVGSFAFYNTAGFHAKDGSGYRFLADYLINLDAINPQVAARLVTPLIQRNGYNQHCNDLMKKQLERIMANKTLSNDLFEKVSKSLLSDAD